MNVCSSKHVCKQWTVNLLQCFLPKKILKKCNYFGKSAKMVSKSALFPLLKSISHYPCCFHFHTKLSNPINISHSICVDQETFPLVTRHPKTIKDSKDIADRLKTASSWQPAGVGWAGARSADALLLLSVRSSAEPRAPSEHRGRPSSLVSAALLRHGTSPSEDLSPRFPGLSRWVWRGWVTFCPDVLPAFPWYTHDTQSRMWRSPSFSSVTQAQVRWWVA